MTTSTLTVADFVLARLAAEEQLARAASINQRLTWATTADSIAGVAGPDAGLFVLFNNPARVLAQCKALRAVVESLTQPDSLLNADARRVAEIAREVVLGNLAAIWAEHPEYREEWAL